MCEGPAGKFRGAEKGAYEKFTCITEAFVRKYESVEKYIKK